MDESTVVLLEKWKQLKQQLITLEKEITNDLKPGQSILIEGAMATYLGCNLLSDERDKTVYGKHIVFKKGEKNER